MQAVTARHRPRLRISGVRKAYGGRQVLRDVDLDVPAGTLVGVVGENGAGKSTLLQIAVGHLAPDRGTVTRIGAVAYCPQQAVLNVAFTVGQHLRLFQTRWAGKELPTVSQWEKAARGPKGRASPWGSDPTAAKWRCTGVPRRVGSRPA